MGGRQQFYYGRVHAFALQHLVDQCDDSPVGIIGIPTSFQDAGIAAFKTQREHIERNIGTRLINNTYHSERNRDTCQHQSVFQSLVLLHLAQRILQGCHMAHVGSNTLQPLVCQL